MKLLIDADYIVYKSCAAAEYDIAVSYTHLRAHET